MLPSPEFGDFVGPRPALGSSAEEPAWLQALRAARAAAAETVDAIAAAPGDRERQRCLARHARAMRELARALETVRRVLEQQLR